jgi:hypothetical protein
MDLRTRLYVIYSDGVVETDFSHDAQDFSRDSFDIQLTTDDFIYVGYKKPINALYMAMTTPNTVASSLTVEYYSESGWSALETSEDTRGLTRNGFITWERVTDSAEIAVAGKAQHWVRIAANDDIDQVTFQAISLVLADDQDIAKEMPTLLDTCFYPQGQSSHILQHVATRNYIMSRLRYKGYIKWDENNDHQNINMWDILDIYEFRQAATYHAISQIYFAISDDPEDHYWAKYEEYEKKFDQAFNNGLTTIDLDDDGKVDNAEKRQIRSMRWSR